MSDPVTDTLRQLEAAAVRSSSVLVSFSGGKDSLAVLDLCTRTFERVEAFFMYFVPGQRYIEARLRAATERWGVRIHQVPHWALPAQLYGDSLKELPPAYTFPDKDNALEFEGIGIIEVWADVMAEFGIPLVATGGRKSDGVWRKRQMSTTACDDVIHPIREWSKFDVLSYLGARKIPVPAAGSARGEAGGQDLSTKHLLWLHDTHPEDFADLCRMFPFAGAVVRRREWFGGRQEAQDQR